MNTKVVAIVNQKGGVGKTTTTLNLGVSLAYLAQETLVLDLDAQSNLTSGIVNRNSVQQESNRDLFQNEIINIDSEMNIKYDPQAALSGGTTYDISDMLLEPTVVKSSIVPTKVEFLDIIPSSGNLVGIELLLKDLERRESRLAEAVKEASSSYRYVLIDCPPSLGLLTINALCAADYILIPMTPEYYALEGLSMLVHTIRRVQETKNPKLAILGIVFNMFDPRLQLTQQILREVRSFFGELVWDTTVPRNVRLAESPSFSLPIHIYAPKSPGTQAYMEMGKEFLVRISN